MCSIIGHSTGFKLCVQNTSKFLKLKYITVTIAVSSITGRCKSVCCNVHEESVTRQAGGCIGMMVLKTKSFSLHGARN